MFRYIICVPVLFLLLAQDSSIASGAPGKPDWSAFNPNYPRTFSMRFGSGSAPQYNSAWQTWASRQTLVGIEQDFTGASRSFPVNVDTTIQALHSAGVPIVLQYVNVPAYGLAGDGTDAHRRGAGQRPGVHNYITANSWAMWQAGTSGTLSMIGSGCTTTANCSSGVAIPNMSTYVPADSGGRQYSQWRSDYIDGMYVYCTGTYANSNTAQCSSHTDGIYMDDTWEYPFNGTSADINRDGTNDPINATNIRGTLGQNWRQGVANFFNRRLSNHPAEFLFGNDAAFAIARNNRVALTDPLLINNLAGVMHGAEFQFAFNWGCYEGYTGSTVGPYSILAGYQMMTTLLTQSPHLIALDSRDLTSDGKAALTWCLTGSESGCSAPGKGDCSQILTQTPAYQGSRSYIAFALMGPGMIGFDGLRTAVTSSNLIWFDELGAVVSQYPRGWLGQPLDAAFPSPLTLGGQSVYHRRFQGTPHSPSGSGICDVFMTPRENTAATTVTFASVSGMPATMYHLNVPSGAGHDPLNNGAAITSITLQPLDGTILCRDAQ